MSAFNIKLSSVCSKIWGFREKQNIWSDDESEYRSQPNLIYKQLDGLRAILIPLSLSNSDIGFKFNYYNLPKEEFIKEIKSIVEYLTKSATYFWAAPHIYSVEPQQVNFTDMAADSLTFSLNALKIPSINNELKRSIRNLIVKSIECLTNENNYFYDKKKGMAAWAGTTFYESEKYELKNLYFTAQTISALGEWLNEPIDLNQKVDRKHVENIEELVKSGCKWILSQEHQDGYLCTNTSHQKIANISTNELITVNSTALRTCIVLKKYLNKTNEQRLKEVCKVFLKYLEGNKPNPDASWDHQVFVKDVGYQYYPDRVDNYGTTSFLAHASGYVEDLKAQTEDLSVFFYREYLEHDADDLLIGCLPFYVDDIIHTQKAFSSLYEDTLVSNRILKKAIYKTFQDDPRVVDVISRSILKYLPYIQQSSDAVELQSHLENKKAAVKKKKRKAK